MDFNFGFSFLFQKPWYKGFKGEIEAYGDARFMTSGEISILSDNQLEITELPVGTWTQAYKENVLEPLLHGVDNKVPPVIQYVLGTYEN